MTFEWTLGTHQELYGCLLVSLLAGPWVKRVVPLLFSFCEGSAVTPPRFSSTQRVARKGMEALSSQGATWRVQVGEVSWYKKDFFPRENNQSLEQPLQGCGRVPITGGFQDVVGQVPSSLGCCMSWPWGSARWRWLCPTAAPYQQIRSELGCWHILLLVQPGVHRGANIPRCMETSAEWGWEEKQRKSGGWGWWHFVPFGSCICLRCCASNQGSCSGEKWFCFLTRGSAQPPQQPFPYWLRSCFLWQPASALQPAPLLASEQKPIPATC